jgi:hypothetical protein
MQEEYRRLVKSLYNAIIYLSSFIVLASLALIYFSLVGNPFEPTNPPLKKVETTKSPDQADEEEDKIVNGIHLATGLKVAKGFDLVKRNCTACHSGQLIAQNRASRAGWKEMIQWMQATQGLWDLGEQETEILDYLATQYAPEPISRRANLDVEAIEWYILEVRGER